MSEVKLSWSQAEVNDAALSVPLDGEVPKGWKQSFERTVVLLGSGGWGEVKLRKGKVLVADVAPGSEEKLRHHLDAVVAQANATLGLDDDDEDEPEDDEDGQDDGEDEGERADPDAEMTERFRAE
jgi:hypothetical protein